MLIVAVALAWVGCRRHAERVDAPPAAQQQPSQQLTTQPQATQQQQPAQPKPTVAVRGIDPVARTFTASSTGVRLSYPPGWEPTPSSDFALMLTPPNHASHDAAPAASGSAWPERFVSLDIPDLPAVRIPGFLPLDQIRKGYLDDLRHQCPGARSQNLPPPAIAGAKAVMVHSTWPGDHPTHAETALLMTHADRVYILRGRSRIEDEAATRAAFDQIVQSLRWQGK